MFTSGCSTVSINLDVCPWKHIKENIFETTAMEVVFTSDIFHVWVGLGTTLVLDDLCKQIFACECRIYRQGTRIFVSTVFWFLFVVSRTLFETKAVAAEITACSCDMFEQFLFFSCYKVM